VILASGCSHAIDLSICVLATHGQNILIPRPGFPLYKTLTSVYGIQYKQYNLLADKNWSIDLKHLESLIDENTAAIVVNNPSNPCGSVFSRKHLLEILELAEKYKKPIIADEIYDKFVFTQEIYKRHRQSHTDSQAPRINGQSRGWIDGRFNAENRQPPVKTRSTGGETYGSFYQTAKVTQIDDVSLEDMEEVALANLGNGIQSQVSEGFELDELEARSHGVGVGDHEDDDEGDLGTPYVPFRALSSLSKTVPILTCGGISKTCLIPGLRLGWIVINDRQNVFDASVRSGLNRLTQRLMGPSSLVQGALKDILTTVPESFYTQTMDFIFKNAQLCYERLRLVNGLQPHMPQGSMYLMVRFDPKAFPNIESDLDFTSKLMNEESVLVLPGKCFDFPNYFRICLTVPTNVMEEALERIRDFCDRYNTNLDGSKITKIVQAQNETPLLKINLSSTNNMNGHQVSGCN